MLRWAGIVGLKKNGVAQIRLAGSKNRAIEPDFTWQGIGPIGSK